MKKLAWVGLLAAAAAAPGCATIVASGPDVISVGSKPDGATVSLDGMAVGKTPCQVRVTRDAEGVFAFEAPGYQKATVDRDKVVNGWFFGNLFIGGALGITIDLICHNQGKYSTDPIFVELTPLVEVTPGAAKP